MLIALPNVNQGLPTLLNALSKPGAVERMLKSQLLEKNGTVYLPRFKLKENVELPSILESIGITDLFTNRRDLSGITEDRRLSVSGIYHSAVLEVCHPTLLNSI